MKNLIVFVTLLCLTLAAQAQRKNEIQVRAGYGLGAYKTETRLAYTFGNTTFSVDTTDGAATSHVPIELRYEISQRVNVGIDMKFGKYLYAPEDQKSGRFNNFNIIGIGVEANLFSDEDARVYINGGFNTGAVEMHDVTDGLNGLSQKIVYKGNGIKINLGTIFFIKNGPLGINLNIGYDKHNFKLKTYELEGIMQDITNLSGALEVGGLELNGGLVFRIKT
jgi:hypothetical protein